MKRVLILIALLASCSAGVVTAASTNSHPNILWITCEDIGPQLGCYGDRYATTPNLDALASRGMIYRHVWSAAPVCAPARTGIISGLYPTATGAEHMRSLVALPSGFRMYPQFLREAGYYCANNNKEDYNLAKPGKVWDDSSTKAHWTNCAPGQPFFAIFNHTVTHESQVRKRPHDFVHDPAKVRVPAYHPDTPEVRRDWAQYYDQITVMDGLAGRNLRELDQAGLADDTIVFFYGDHGAGMPRSKRTPCNSGLRVGLIVYFPEKWRHLAPKDYQPGGSSERLVSFLDLAPTLLSLAGTPPPEWMHGRAFAGKFTAPAPEFLHGYRGRMDERYDLVRSVTDGRYVYLRNYLPHLPAGQHVNFMFETPTTRVWKDLFDAGKLAPPQTYFWERRQPEELYDLQTDRDEVNNLAASPQHQEILQRLRHAQQEQARRVRDVGFLPEGEIHTRSVGSTPYEMGHDDAKYPFEKIFAMAELASALRPDAVPQLAAGLADSDSAVRYWAALGLLMRGAPAVTEARVKLEAAFSDATPHVRIVAAQALAQFGNASDLQKSLAILVELASLKNHSVHVSLQALNALDALGPKASGVKTEIAKLPAKVPKMPERTAGYVPRLLEQLTGKKLAEE